MQDEKTEEHEGERPHGGAADSSGHCSAGWNPEPAMTPQPVDRAWFRRTDFSLCSDDTAVQEAFRSFFAKECPPAVVRAAEPLGHDPRLWTLLGEMGAIRMAVPIAEGGDGATLVDLAIVAEEVGRALAPVPFVSHIVATRLLARLAPSSEVFRAALHGEQVITLAMTPIYGDRLQLLPNGAISQSAVYLHDGQLCLDTRTGPSQPAPSLGGTPVAWWKPSMQEPHVVATGQEAVDAYNEALKEWELLMAAALIGMAGQSLTLAVDVAGTRKTQGVPIGSLQGVSFPLADVEIQTCGGRNLVRKAAWMRHHEPEVRPELATMAFLNAVHVATHGTATCAHMQGGSGYTIESDASLYLLRAKAWSSLRGDLQAGFQAVGDAVINRN